MGPIDGWIHHVGQLTLLADENWWCFAFHVGDAQVAAPLEPTAALSRYYLSWADRTRLYGELQYLSQSSDGIDVESVPVCSYRVMVRAQLLGPRRVTAEDWQALSLWVRSVPGMQPAEAKLLMQKIRDLHATLGPLWARSPSSVARARKQLEVVSVQHPLLSAEVLYKWMRLFLA